VNPLVLVVDDEPDLEVLFRQQFRRDLRTDRFTMEFAQSAPMALQRITDAGDRSLILILSEINITVTASCGRSRRGCRPSRLMAVRWRRIEVRAAIAARRSADRRSRAPKVEPDPQGPPGSKTHPRASKGLGGPIR
jgi:CheY-like chemotaxis protein